MLKIEKFIDEFNSNSELLNKTQLIDNTEIKVVKKEENFNEFEISPLDNGFGYTLGNTLRRLLLSSIPGCAITSVSINDIMHEFQSLKGMKEEVIELHLNLMGIYLKINSGISAKLQIVKKKGFTGDITAKDIKCVEGKIEIINPDHYIASLSNLSEDLQIDLSAEWGKGYKLISSDNMKKRNEELGKIFLDANFSPVLQVSSNVTKQRVKQAIDNDRLNLGIRTNGVLSPQDCLVWAIKIINKEFNYIIEKLRYNETSTS